MMGKRRQRREQQRRLERFQQAAGVRREQEDRVVPGHPGRSLARVALGGFLTFAGIGHLTFSRQEFQAQVPSWVPLDPDLVVLGSGVVEIALGLGLISGKRPKMFGHLATGLFIGVFPGNIAQFVERRDGFGLDTDRKRAARLLFQPVLVDWALSSTRQD
ncbi:DoxX family protein [Rothia kristinae]